MNGSSDSTYDIVIVGSGVAGSAAAIHYGRLGLRVALLDRSPDPQHFKKTCTHSIQASAEPFIEELGIADELRAERVPQQGRLRLYTPSGWIVFDLDEGYPHPRFGCNVRRETLDPLLRRRAAALASVDLLLGVHVEDVLRSGSRVCGVRARRRDGSRIELRSRLVVGADGRDSKVAAAAELWSRRMRNERFAMWGYFSDVDAVAWPDNQIYLMDPTWCYVMPTDNGLCVLGIVGPKSRLPEMRRDPAAYHRRMLSRLPDGPTYDRARQEGEFVARLDMTNIYRRPAAPGIALVGDAAMAVDPVWGWGCGFALRSASHLVAETREALLSPGGDLDASLRRYLRRHLLVFGGYYAHALTYTNARRFTPIERVLFAAATVDPKTARHIHAYSANSSGVIAFTSPRAIGRALRVCATNLPSLATYQASPPPVPAIAAS